MNKIIDGTIARLVDLFDLEDSFSELDMIIEDMANDLSESRNENEK